MPLIGHVPAGIPLDAVEMAEDIFPLPQRLVGRGTLFMLKVTGDSLIEAAIAEGDIVVVVRKQPTAGSGEIVAAHLGGTATVEATQGAAGMPSASRPKPNRSLARAA